MFDMRPYRNNNDRRNNLSAYNPFRFDKKDIHLDVNGDTLTIHAERKAEQEEKDDKNNYVRCERSFGSYSRQFDLSSVDADHMKATYDNGVLKLEMPKKALPDSARHIEIE